MSWLRRTNKDEKPEKPTAPAVTREEQAAKAMRLLRLLRPLLYADPKESFNSYGSKFSVILKTDTPQDTRDEITGLIEEIFRDQGIAMPAGTRSERVSKSGPIFIEIEMGTKENWDKMMELQSRGFGLVPPGKKNGASEGKT